MSFQEVGSMDELENAIDSNDNVMVVFSKDQCPACNTMGMWLDRQFLPKQEQAERPLTIVKAKLESLGRGMVESFGLRTFPSTLLFNRGDEVYRVAGFTNPAPVESAISTHLQTA